MRRLSDYTLKQIIRGLMRRGGRVVFIVFTPFLMIPVLLIRILSPFILIRLKVVRSSRLGHFASEPDMYLAQRAIDSSPKRTVDIFGFDEFGLCNKQLARMWARNFYVVPFLRYIVRANKLIPGWKKHEVPWVTGNDRMGVLFKTKSFLYFTNKERVFGEEQFQKILNGRPTRFVCIANRDSKYLNKHHKYKKWNYHNYRNSNILNYIPAMEWLSQQGYTVVRMGAAVATQLPTNLHHNIIDYATLHRSDFMDIYLSKYCKFMITAVTGTTNLGTGFRRPMAHLNAVPFMTLDGCAANRNEFFIPKRYFSEQNDCFMSIKEIVTIDAHRYFLTDDYKNSAIRLVENDVTDILNITREIEGLVTGKFTITDADTELRHKFWEAQMVDYNIAKHYPQPSPAFLMRHKDTLFR